MKTLWIIIGLLWSPIELLYGAMFHNKVSKIGVKIFTNLYNYNTKKKNEDRKKISNDENSYH